jgi:beta-lactam-binding protein with PASTA domain
VFSSKPRNQVVSQTPDASRNLSRGAAVALGVSKGPKARPVPDVVGQTLADALQTLRAAELESRIVRVPGDEPAGQVLAQHPSATAKAAAGAVIRLNVSDGAKPKPTTTPPPATETATAATAHADAPTTTRPATKPPSVTAPDLSGMRLTDARTRLHRIGLLIEIRRVPSDQPLGTVVAQAKRPGATLKPGAHLLVTVSMGRPEPASSAPPSNSGRVSVPPVTGEDEIMATQDLQAAGLTVRVVDQDTADQTQDGVVVDQTPTPSMPVRPGSTVTISVGRYADG